jgi:hypothetical protein
MVVIVAVPSGGISVGRRHWRCRPTKVEILRVLGRPMVEILRVLGRPMVEILRVLGRSMPLNLSVQQ